MRASFRRAAIALAAVLSAASASAAGVQVGTYYFPGWHPDPFTGNKDNWAPIRAYPEREPQQGWYDDRDPKVLQTQANQMKAAGIDFVLFDWYFENDKVQAQAPMDAYLKLPAGVPPAGLYWARHGKSPPTTAAEWQQVVQLWIGYARSPNFYRIDGQPVVGIFDTARLANDAKAAGSDLSGWVTQAQDAASKAGLPPFYFVAGVWNGDDPTIQQAAKAGFKSITSYNFRRAPSDQRDAHGFVQRDDVYQRIWLRMVAKGAGLSPILPLTSGWDKRPWGGSEDKDDDKSTPTDTQFRAHLTAARKFMDANHVDRAIVCCWNEYGEGSIIEPTKSGGDEKLKAIRDVLKGN